MAASGATPPHLDIDDAPISVVGAVLCGGRSSRFGTDKALVEVDGTPLGLRVIAALRAGGADPIVAVGGTAGGLLGVPTIADRLPDEGPLAALASVLLWARRGLVVVTSCDVPLLSGTHVAPLIDVASATAGRERTAQRAAVAVVGGRPQPSLACWPASWGPDLMSLIRSGDRAWRQALDVGPWEGVELPAAAVADADTPDELRSLLAKPLDQPDDGAR